MIYEHYLGSQVGTHLILLSFNIESLSHGYESHACKRQGRFTAYIEKKLTYYPQNKVLSSF